MADSVHQFEDETAGYITCCSVNNLAKYAKYSRNLKGRGDKRIFDANPMTEYIKDITVKISIKISPRYTYVIFFTNTYTLYFYLHVLPDKQYLPCFSNIVFIFSLQYSLQKHKTYLLLHNTNYLIEIHSLSLLNLYYIETEEVMII